MSAFSHSIERAKERYNLELNGFDLGVIRELIILGHAVLMSRGENGKNIYLLRYRETTMKLVFCEISQRVITILPSSGKLRKRQQRSGGKMPRKNARLRKVGRAISSYGSNLVGV